VVSLACALAIIKALWLEINEDIAIEKQQNFTSLKLALQNLFFWRKAEILPAMPNPLAKWRQVWVQGEASS
jgi:cyd operon protein YbgT